MTTVLVAEDEFALLSVLALVLEAEGFSVHKASHGREALAILRTERCDAVLCDEMMPMMNGAALAREIRKLPGYAATPIFMMAEVLREPIPEGVTAILPKPVRIDALLAALRARV